MFAYVCNEKTWNASGKYKMKKDEAQNVFQRFSVPISGGGRRTDFGNKFFMEIGILEFANDTIQVFFMVRGEISLDVCNRVIPPFLFSWFRACNENRMLEVPIVFS